MHRPFSTCAPNSLVSQTAPNDKGIVILIARTYKSPQLICRQFVPDLRDEQFRLLSGKKTNAAGYFFRTVVIPPPPASSKDTLAA